MGRREQEWKLYFQLGGGFWGSGDDNQGIQETFSEVESVGLVFGLGVGWEGKGRAEMNSSVPGFHWCRSQNLWFVGQIQSSTCFCTANE